MHALSLSVAALLAALLTAGPAWAGDEPDEIPFGAVAVLIETTDNDIELQVFVDGSGQWRNLEIFDPLDRKIFDLTPMNKLRRQGMSELLFASKPDAFPEDDEGETDPESRATRRVIKKFLRRFPEGRYEAETRLPGGLELEGEARLTHLLPGLPEILHPDPDADEPPVVPANDAVIEWEPVTEDFFGRRPVDVVEYQIIVEPDEPDRTEPWIDGTGRRFVVNVGAETTSVTVPVEYLRPGTLYGFEVLAIEESGNVTISESEFATAD